MSAELDAIIDDLDPDGSIRAGRRNGEAQPASPVPSAARLDHDRLARRVRAYLAACPGAVSGQGGHAHTFEVAQSLVNGFMLDREAAIGYLLAEWNPKCEPAWSMAELTHKVDDAIAKPCSKPRGWLVADDALPVDPSVFGPASPSPASPSPSPSAGQPGRVAINPDLEDDDPRRLAHALLAGYRDGQTLVHYLGQFHEWDGAAYIAPDAGRFRGRIHNAIGREVDAIHSVRKRNYDPDSGDKPPRPIKVTVSLVNNVEAALAARCGIDATESPAWIHDATGPNPIDLVVTRGGTIHLPAYASGRPDAITPNTPDLFTLNALDFAADRNAPEPVEWLRFLGTLWPADPESVALLQEWFGYVLTPDTSQQKMLLLLGPKRCGKGTIARVLQEMVGLRNCANPTLGSLGNEFGLAPLLGKTLAVIEDARLSHRSDLATITERLLTISGEGRIDVNRKHLAFVSGRVSARIVIATNIIPKLPDDGAALGGRWSILRMTESFFGREDLGLKDRLSAELPAIFNWAVAGWKRLREQGRFTAPESTREVQEDVLDCTSPLIEWVRECCVIGPREYDAVDSLYSDWRRWCEANGRREAGTINDFGRQIRAAIPTVRKTRIRVNGRQVANYQGVRLSVHDGDLPPDRLPFEHHEHDEFFIARETEKETQNVKENTVNDSSCSLYSGREVEL